MSFEDEQSPALITASKTRLALFAKLRVLPNQTYDRFEAQILLGNQVIGYGRDVETTKSLLHAAKTYVQRLDEINRYRKVAGAEPLPNLPLLEGELSVINDPSLLGAFPWAVQQDKMLPQMAFIEYLADGTSGELDATLIAMAANGFDEAEQLKEQAKRDAEQHRPKDQTADQADDEAAQ